MFCRECGQEYYCVRRVEDSDSGAVNYIPRELSDRSNDGDSRAGFLYFSAENPWPSARRRRFEGCRRTGSRRLIGVRASSLEEKKNVPRPIRRAPMAKKTWAALSAISWRALLFLPALRGRLRLPHDV